MITFQRWVLLLNHQYMDHNLHYKIDNEDLLESRDLLWLGLISRWRSESDQRLIVIYSYLKGVGGRGVGRRALLGSQPVVAFELICSQTSISSNGEIVTTFASFLRSGNQMTAVWDLSWVMHGNRKLLSSLQFTDNSVQGLKFFKLQRKSLFVREVKNLLRDESDADEECLRYSLMPNNQIIKGLWYWNHIISLSMVVIWSPSHAMQWFMSFTGIDWVHRFLSSFDSTLNWVQILWSFTRNQRLG